MEKLKVLLDPKPRKVEWVFAAEDYERLKALADIVWGQNEAMPLEAFEQIKETLTAVITGRWRYGPVTGMPNLRAILEVSGGPPSPQSLDYETCFKNNIRVLSCAPAFGPTVAEMALGLAIATARGIVETDGRMRRGEEKYSRAGNERAFTLYRKKIGLIGFGGLARSLKPLLDPFQPDYQVYDPWMSPHYLRKLGLHPVDLDTLLQTCQVIFVLAVPSIENQHMIDRRRLSLIQKEAIFLLISRAHVVDFEALIELVNAGHFRAAIDVYPQEPVPATHPIRQSKNTILTSHIAGNVPADFQNIGNMVVNDLEAILSGLPPNEMQVTQPEIIHHLFRK